MPCGFVHRIVLLQIVMDFKYNLQGIFYGLSNWMPESLSFAPAEL